MGLADNLIGGLIVGAGQFAKDLRAAITGKSILTPEAQAKLLEQAQNLESQALNMDQALAQGQLSINLEEAKSDNPIKSLWRPATAWVCVFGLFYQLILRNLLPWSLQVIGLIMNKNLNVPIMPTLELDTLMVLLSGLLGFGGFRTYEKIKKSA